MSEKNCCKNVNIRMIGREGYIVPATRAFRSAPPVGISWRASRKTSASSRTTIAFQMVAYSRTCFSLYSKNHGRFALLSSPMVVLNNALPVISAADSAGNQQYCRAFKRETGANLQSTSFLSLVYRGEE